MTCPSGNTPNERIRGFSARYILNGDYSGSIEFVDPDCVDSAPCVGFCMPVRTSITTSLIRGTTESDEISAAIKDCYNTSPFWVNGLLASFERSNKEFTSTYDFTSYFEYLKNKAVSTQQFLGVPLSTVFSAVFSLYAGVPSGLLNVASYKNNFVKGPVEGNDLWKELQLLAQAGEADLFVQVGGILTIERWKDHTSAVELVIPDEVLISAERAKYTSPNTTAIRVRGASISGFAQGVRPLTNNELGPGSVNKCVVSGLKTPVVEVSFNNLTGKEEDIRNAGIMASNFNVFKEKAKIVNNGFNAKIRNLSPNEFFGPAPKFSEFMIFGKVRSDIDEKLGGRPAAPNRNSGFSPSNIIQAVRNYGFPVPHSSFGKGAFGSQDFNENTAGGAGLISDRNSLQQVETVLFDPQISVCGISFEELENKYVFSKPVLFRIAARRYQEIKLAQNTWNVEIAYYPCVRLNQVVEFRVPPTENCPDHVVKGIIAGIDIVHSTSDEGIQDTSMALSIMDVSCLGNETFVSGNLVVPIHVVSGLGTTGWQTSIQDLSNQSTVDDCIFLFNKGGGVPVFAEFVTTELEVGTTYQWGFDYTSLLGGPSLQFIGTNVPGSTTLSGSGSLGDTFTATTANAVFRWQIDPTAVGQGVNICNFFLVAQKEV